MRVPAIYETSRGEPTDENPTGQPVSTVSDYGRDMGVGYVEGDTSLAVSTNSDYTANNFPANVNGVATTYAWTRADTDTTTTLTDDDERVCNWLPMVILGLVLRLLLLTHKLTTPLTLKPLLSLFRDTLGKHLRVGLSLLWLLALRDNQLPNVR